VQQHTPRSRSGSQPRDHDPHAHAQSTYRILQSGPYAVTQRGDPATTLPYCPGSLLRSANSEKPQQNISQSAVSSDFAASRRRLHSRSSIISQQSYLSNRISAIVSQQSYLSNRISATAWASRSLGQATWTVDLSSGDLGSRPSIIIRLRSLSQ
jgi:hypothetical protein